MRRPAIHSGTQPPVDQSKRLRFLRYLGAFGLIGLLLTRPVWNEASPMHEMTELLGLALVLLCVFGRLWSTLYVGGRKNTELVISGPYSVSRNPLYLFSTLGSFGSGLLFGSITAATLLGVTTYLVFFATARKEERYLHARFGAEYESYAGRTPLFWPRLSSYREPRETSFSPNAIWRTFGDACFFFMILPLAEISEYLHAQGYVPTVLRMY